MPNYKAVVQYETVEYDVDVADSKGVYHKETRTKQVVKKDAQGHIVTKSFLVDANGEIACDIPFEDDDIEVKRRIDILAFKTMLRSGEKFFEINNDPRSPRYGKREFIAPHSKTPGCEGSLDIALAEFAEEEKIRKAVEVKVKEEMAKKKEPAKK